PMQNALAMQLLFAGIAIALLWIRARVEMRWRAIELSRSRNEQHRLALEVAQMGAWELSVADHALELSAEAERILGIANHEPVRSLEHLLAHVHPADRESLSSAV